MATSDVEINFSTKGVEELRSEVQALTTDLRQARTEIDALRAEETGRSPLVRILREPLTYDARLVRDPASPRGFHAITTRGDYSYVQDLARHQFTGDQYATARLERHAQEMRKIGEARERVFHPDVEYGFEQRAVNWTSGQGGYFAPPLWLIEQFAVQPTPERVISKLAPQFELPEGVQSVNLPAWTAGGEVGPAQVGAAGADTATTDTAVSSAVTTLAGTYDAPLQMLEQSSQGAHLDWIVFTAMEARYAYQLELQLLTGAGAAVPQGSGNDQLLGIFNNPAIPAANLVSYTGVGEASPGTTGSPAAGATGMFSFIGFLVSKVGQSRNLPPEGWLMTTSRSAWLGSSEDQQSRPLMLADDSSRPGGWDLLGYPIYPNDAIPRTSGLGANEERIISFRHSDWLILESERKTTVDHLKRDTGGGATARGTDYGVAMTDALSGALMVRFQMRRYVAALLRYPSSIAYLQGSGMATSGGW